MYKLVILSIFSLGLLSACAQQDENKLKERAEIDGRAAATADQEALNKKVMDMEKDLAIRHRFFHAVSGRYEGKAKSPTGNFFKIKLLLVPSIAPLPSSPRVRTIEEVASDLNSLHFNAEILNMDLAEQYSGGCIFTEVRPDLVNGSIALISNECQRTYVMNLSVVDETGMLISSSQTISQSILDGTTNQVMHLNGHMVSAITGGTSEFNLTRLQP